MSEDKKIIAYKKKLGTPTKNHIQDSKENYLAFLKENMMMLYSGEIGVYLTSKVNFNGQNLYFPFINIDGERGFPRKAERDVKIDRTIEDTLCTYKILKKLSADSYFHIIATGNTGFRIVSNILLNIQHYRAFITLLRREMSHIKDIESTELIESKAHQLFAYKHWNQQMKELIDGHSLVIPNHVFENGDMTYEYYQDKTKENPDPTAIINFMESFLNFNPISDLESLGEFGKRLQKYHFPPHEVSIDRTFDKNRINKRRRIQRSQSLELIKERLQAQNIPCKIENRMGEDLISFNDLPCPICKDTSSEAWAAFPYYNLRCRNNKCKAFWVRGGVPLKLWAGFSPMKLSFEDIKKDNSLLKAPTDFVSKEEARNRIFETLGNEDDSLILVTPGVGKTFSALKYLAENMDDKLIFYSCLNRGLKKEAFEMMKGFFDESSDQLDNIHMLQSMDEICQKNNEMKHLVNKGFFPGGMICTECQYYADCEYHNQRTKIGKGVYFVTHQMLEYLEKKNRSYYPDLIILDENLLQSFSREDGCKEVHIKTLATVLSQDEYTLIDEILKIGQELASEAKLTQEPYPIILNGKKLTPYEDSLVYHLSIRLETTEVEIRKNILRIVSKINRMSKGELYEKGLDFRAVNWLEAFLNYNELPAFKRLKTRYPYLWIDNKGNVEYIFRYIAPLLYKRPPPSMGAAENTEISEPLKDANIKIMDATGNKEISECLTRRRIQEIKADVEWPARKIHIKRRTTRNVIRPTTKDKELKQILTPAIEMINSEKILVITYKFLMKRALILCRQIDPNRIYEGHHFQADRGINRYKDFDGAIVLGTPYANVKKAYLGACVLFSKDENMKNMYTDLFMNWEVVQCIHRIRPVNKEEGKIAEVVVISAFWPPMLPEPDEVIDNLNEMEWKELAIKKLEQHIKEFGFLNADIGYIAEVYVKQKQNVFNKFQNKMNGLTEAYDLAFNSNSHDNEINLERLKLIRLIKNSIKERLTWGNNDIIPRIKNLSIQQLEDPLPLTKTNQWTEILDYFKEKYPHFEKFRIKLPHTRGNAVDGVGDKKSVLNFYNHYNQISQSKIFRKVDLESYKTIEDKITTVDSIPDEFAVVYIPQYKRPVRIIYFGSGNDIIPIPIYYLATFFIKFRTLFLKLIKKKRVITNVGKELVWLSILSGITPFEINDVNLNETIIKNGNEFPRTIHPEYLFRQYGLTHDVDLKMLISQLYKVWEKQQNLIEELNLRDVIDLENIIQWIMPKIERTGIGVDVVRLLEYQEKMESKVNNPSARNDKRIPLLNRIINKLKTEARLDAVNAAVHQVENDGRIHARINQRSITGKFTFNGLDKAKRDNHLKSCFRAKPGYKFVIGFYPHYKLRIILGLSDDQKNIELLNQNRDIYLDLLMVLTGRSEEECKPFGRIGEGIFSRFCYGTALHLLYPRIKNKIGLSMSPDEFVKLMEGNYSEIISWKERILKEAKENGYITTPFGRRRNISKRLLKNPPSLYNFLVKGTGADGLKMALTDLDGQLKTLDARIAHLTNDEIIVEARDDLTEKVAEIMAKCMEKPFRELLPNVLFEIVLIIGNTWGIEE